MHWTLYTYLGFFSGGGDIGGYAIFSNTPLVAAEGHHVRY